MKVTFPGLLFIVFLVLKLTHLIDWSWWWVSAPIWVVALGAGLKAAVVEIYYASFASPQERAARAMRELADKIGRSHG